MLDDISEPLLCHMLRKRFTEGDGSKFYTSAGTILIALNPYKSFPIYSAAHIKDYRHLGNRALPPHVFQVASAAHTKLTLEARDQAILISGESGAGKTEATKHCLAFLAEVAGSDSAFETQVLAATPSSRPLATRRPSATTTRRALAAGSRSTLTTAARSRQRGSSSTCSRSRAWCTRRRTSAPTMSCTCCASPTRASASGCSTRPRTAFLNASGCYTVDGRQSEAEEYRLLINAMEGLGFEGGDGDGDGESKDGGASSGEIGEIFAFLAAILLLGNLTFESTAERKGEPGCKVENGEEAARIAELWQVAPAALSAH